MPTFFEHNSLDPFPLGKNSVNLCFTSPPYFDQRNYRNEPRQIGCEETVEQYVDKMVQVGRNVWDVLAGDGSYFLNIGDKYVEKNLLLVPYRVAIAMMNDGWILRNVIIWYKPNHMPYAIKDRLTPTYEPIFHFVKNPKYYYDLDSIRVGHETIKVPSYVTSKTIAERFGSEFVEMDNLMGVETVKKEGYENTKLEGVDTKNIGARGGFAKRGETLENRYAEGGKNPGDMFFDVQPSTLVLSPTTSDHSNPEINGIGEHIERDAAGLCLLQSLVMACPECGAEFQTAVDKIYRTNPEDIWKVNTVGLKDSHFAIFPEKLVELVVKVGSRIGDTVLDCFSGSGTTAVVAERLGRNGIGLDLEFQDVRDRRLQYGIQPDLFIP